MSETGSPGGVINLQEPLVFEYAAQNNHVNRNLIMAGATRLVGVAVACGINTTFEKV